MSHTDDTNPKKPSSVSSIEKPGAEQVSDVLSQDEKDFIERIKSELNPENIENLHYAIIMYKDIP